MKKSSYIASMEVIHKPLPENPDRPSLLASALRNLKAGQHVRIDLNDSTGVRSIRTQISVHGGKMNRRFQVVQPSPKTLLVASA